MIFIVAIILNHMLRIGKEFKVPKKCIGERVEEKTTKYIWALSNIKH